MSCLGLFSEFLLSRLNPKTSAAPNPQQINTNIISYLGRNSMCFNTPVSADAFISRNQFFEISSFILRFFFFFFSVQFSFYFFLATS